MQSLTGVHPGVHTQCRLLSGRSVRMQPWLEQSPRRLAHCEALRDWFQAPESGSGESRASGPAAWSTWSFGPWGKGANVARKAGLHRLGGCLDASRALGLAGPSLHALRGWVRQEGASLPALATQSAQRTHRAVRPQAVQQSRPSSASGRSPKPCDTVIGSDA